MIVMIGFGTLYLVFRKRESREIVRNLVRFRGGSSPVAYSRVSYMISVHRSAFYLSITWFFYWNILLLQNVNEDDALN